jgi:hypothetical protein
MADACRQRLTASRRKRCNPNSDESRFPYSAPIEAHVSSFCDHQVLRAFEPCFYSMRKWMLLDRSTGFLSLPIPSVRRYHLWLSRRAVSALMYCTWCVICLVLSRSPWKTTSAPCDGRVDPSTEASASLQRRLHENVCHKRYGSMPS